MAKPQLLDIRRIRKALGRTRKDYGWLLSVHCNGLERKPIPSHRLYEWENQSRPVPAKIYRACAETVSDEWAWRRHEAAPAERAQMDVFYGSLISPALGELCNAWHGDLRADVDISEAFISHVRQTFGYDLSYVWE